MEIETQWQSGALHYAVDRPIPDICSFLKVKYNDAPFVMSPPAMKAYSVKGINFNPVWTSELY
jgi:hypothetical protein